ncbi:hypothetical protein IVB40_35025 [Bradyrhizobium sp. 40]|uniref:hypothetical protein n=1 Tax=Bradyrhizobium sp. 40 TaxID=2782674 RepID=UPI001FFF7551|nr:hypothetical protein [Bradyrhizobium sp. 40]UPJ42415.1 hypothetical protein IVB40_35025 [Bradyrhizobium sp. 40]
MKQHGLEQSFLFDDQSNLVEVAINLRKQAEGMPLGIRREELLRKAQQAETAARIANWLASPGLQPPE